MRTYIRFLGSGALTVVGLGATIIVQGGWQAVAAGFAIFEGMVFALTFIELRQAADRSRPGRPSWALGEGSPVGVPDSIPLPPQEAPSRQREDVRSRPAAGVTT